MAMSVDSGKTSQEGSSDAMFVSIDLEASIGRIEDVSMQQTGNGSVEGVTAPSPKKRRRSQTQTTLFSRPSDEEFERGDGHDNSSDENGDEEGRDDRFRIVSPLQPKKKAAVRSCSKGLDFPIPLNIGGMECSDGGEDVAASRVSGSVSSTNAQADSDANRDDDEDDNEDDFSLTSHEAGSLMDESFEFEEFRDDPSSFWLRDMHVATEGTETAAGGTSVSPEPQACQISVVSCRDTTSEQ